MRRRRPSHPLVVALVAFLAVSALGATPRGAVLAQTPCVAETEPNDAPETATVSSGSVCFDATLPDGDQDLFLWDLSPQDASKRWTISLNGVPNTVTALKVLPVDSAPGVTPLDLGSQLLDLSTTPLYAGPVDLPDLLLRPGRYLIGISRSGTPAGGSPTTKDYRFEIGEGAPLPPAHDAEPNDDPAHATPVSSEFAISGQLKGTDDFAWTVPASDADRRWQLEVQGVVGAPLQLELDGPRGKSLVQVSAGSDGRANLYDLALGPGRYVIDLGPAFGDPFPYMLRSSLESGPAFDPEPNDDAATATPLEGGHLVAQGRLARANDHDRYRLHVDDSLAATLVDIKLMWQGTADRQLCLFDATDTQLGCRRGAQGVTLGNLLLPVGDYTLDVYGESSLAAAYLLRIDPTTAPAPDFETEPNDQAIFASAWDPAQVMRGRQAEGDRDYFKVSVTGAPQLWRLDATGSDISGIRWVKRDDTDLAYADLAADRHSAVLEDMYLVPGDHWIRVDATGDYSLRMTPQGPPDPNAEHEPNNDPINAEALGIGQLRLGRLPRPNDTDIQRFSIAAAERLTLRITPPADGAVAYRLYTGVTEMAAERSPIVGQPIVADLALPAGDYELWLGVGQASSGSYSMQLVRNDPFAPAAPLTATLALTMDHTAIAAYWSAGQAIDGQLAIANTGSAEQTLTLDALTSHYAWGVSLLQPVVTVPAGGSVTVPLEVHVLPDAWRDIPVRITLRARDTSGAQGTAFAEITPTADAPPVQPEQAWAVPSALVGGLDVALLSLGATPVPTYDAEAEAQLYDGVTPAGGGFGTTVEALPVTLTVDLAGDEPVPVAGVILDPQARDAYASEAPKGFDLLLSTDGTNYTQVFTGEMTPLPIDQAFTLPSPVPAGFAQLRITSLNGDSTTVALGEFKVIATPGSVPATISPNIADLGRGGHLVRMDPQSADPAVADRMVTEDTIVQSVYVPANVSPEWVLAFDHDRAAQLDRLEWVDPVGSDPSSRFTSVAIATSLDSPLGPWTKVGTWQLKRSGGSVDPFVFDAPIWARYVRYVGNAVKQSIYREEPATLRAIEVPTDANYRSVTAEWGATQAGPYEVLHPPALDAPTYAPDGNDTPDTATALAQGSEVSGTAHTDKDVDWFDVSAGAGQNTLTFTATGRPSVGVSLVLEDGQGFQVPMTFQPGLTPGSVDYVATVDPGATYRLKVQQPPFSAVFTYDTSGSMGSYLSFVFEALRAFSGSVVPGAQSVKIIPFEERPVLDDWSDDPYVLQNAVEGAVTFGGSSSAEAALLAASQELESREGARAILMVTDAETSSYPKAAEAWRRLSEVRPSIFAVHVGANLTAVQSGHWMQDWAASSNGFYQYTSTHGEMDRAFERMATWLERPAQYGLSYAGSFVKPPPADGSPGTLTVNGSNSGDPSKVPVAANVAIEVIFDTSGSMLDRLEGKRRIDIAQSVLTHLIRDKLPAGVPLALRVFGDTPRSCDTRLAVPLGPLDPERVVKEIQGVHVISSVNTPIGAALKQVASDLSGVTGPRIVVLVTDGEENCGGDPAKAAAALARQGVDVHVNIVGFQIGQKSLRRTMAKWAQLGRGTFFDATGSADLNTAVAQSVSAPFRVYDENGKVVATGTVNGDPIRIKPGTYRVEVLTDPVVMFEGVVVAPKGSVALTLPNP